MNFTHSQIAFLRNLALRGSTEKSASQAADFFHVHHGLGRRTGSRFHYDEVDAESARLLLSNRNIAVTASVQALRRSEAALNNPTHEKSGTLAPHQDSVAVKTAHGRCLLNGESVASRGYQVLTLEQACAVHADVLLVVENLESFRFLELNRWIDYQGKEVLAVFRGDNVLKANVAMKLIASRAEPVWAYFDFDPAGLGMASGLPRLERLVLPEEEALTSATRSANQAHLYADQMDQWEAIMQSAEQPVFERPWRLLRQLRLGLAQEHMDSLG
jgi:hypothetical protein